MFTHICRYGKFKKNLNCKSGVKDRLAVYSPQKSSFSKRSIWFRCWPSDDVHRVFSCVESCVESSLLLLEEGVCYNSAFSWQNIISLCPASFRTPRPNLPVTPGVSWLSTFAFQFPIMKRTSFLGVSSKRSYRSS